MIDDWDVYARKIGYINERDMLEKMYLNEGLSISQLSARLDVATFTINRHLDACNIPRRSRGGANNSASQTRKLFRLDQRIVLTLNLDLAAREFGVSKSLVYKYRRQMLGDCHGILHTVTCGGIEEILSTITPPPAVATNQAS